MTENIGLIGTGGVIKQKNEDFIVREILPSGHPIFTGNEIGEDHGGMYTHCVLWKSGLDTFNAINRLCNILNLKEEDIGYAGLKDAKAETYQRISLWNVSSERIKDINMIDLKLINPIRQKFSIKIGDLLGNYFEIVIRDINREWVTEEWDSFKNQIKTKGFLNYFGMQRFGSKRPVLHIIGKLFLQNRYSELIDRYLGDLSPLEFEKITQLRKQYRMGNSYEIIRDKFPKKFSIERTLLNGLSKGFSAKNTVLSLPKSFLRLSISAYQAFIFNKTISILNDVNVSISRNPVVPLPGYKSKKQETSEEAWKILSSLLESDNINFSTFKHEQSSFRSKGSTRNAIVIPTDFTLITQNKEDRMLRISFSLQKGSYATIVTREIIKDRIEYYDS
ncbi:MAG: tRNA pseudouridine(13) synthase TruD [Candidatus Hodarchaeales archaeon]|jgi:tRNA pseudouridine13 synthase